MKTTTDLINWINSLDEQEVNDVLSMGSYYNPGLEYALNEKLFQDWDVITLIRVGKEIELNNEVICEAINEKANEFCPEWDESLSDEENCDIIDQYNEGCWNSGMCGIDPTALVYFMLNGEALDFNYILGQRDNTFTLNDDKLLNREYKLIELVG